MGKAIFHPNQRVTERTRHAEVQVCTGSEKHAETMTSLGNEKADKNALQVEIKRQKEPHDAMVQNLNERIVELKDVQAQFIGTCTCRVYM